MVENLPSHFGRVFDKNKGFEFNENRLEKNDFYEIKIPNLRKPKNLAIFLKYVCCQDYLIQESKEVKSAMEDSYDWPEFYWIANYFNEESILEGIFDNLIEKHQDFCHKLLVKYQIDSKFRVKIQEAISKRKFEASENNLVKRLLEPGCDFSTASIKNLSDLSPEYEVSLALLTKSYCIPIKRNGDKRFVVNENKYGNIFLKNFRARDTLAGRFGKLYKFNFEVHDVAKSTSKVTKSTGGDDNAAEKTKYNTFKYSSTSFKPNLFKYTDTSYKPTSILSPTILKYRSVSKVRNDHWTDYSAKSDTDSSF